MGDEEESAAGFDWAEHKAREYDEITQGLEQSQAERLKGYRQYAKGEDEGPRMTAAAMLDLHCDLELEGASGEVLVSMRKRDLLESMKKLDLVAQEARRFLNTVSAIGVPINKVLAVVAMEAVCADEGVQPMDRAGSFILALENRWRTIHKRQGGRPLKSNETPPWREDLVELAQSLGWCNGKSSPVTQLGKKLSDLGTAEAGLGRMGSYMRADDAGRRVAHAMRTRVTKEEK